MVSDNISLFIIFSHRYTLYDLTVSINIPYHTEKRFFQKPKSMNALNSKDINRVVHFDWLYCGIIID